MREVEETVGLGPVTGTPASRSGHRQRRLGSPAGLLEELLSDRLSTRVKVAMGAARSVVIDFASLEDLERICGR